MSPALTGGFFTVSHQGSPSLLFLPPSLLQMRKSQKEIPGSLYKDTQREWAAELGFKLRPPALNLHMRVSSSHSTQVWMNSAAGPPAQQLGRLFSIHQDFFTSAQSKLSSLPKGAFEMHRLTALFVDPHCGFWLELAGHGLCGCQSFKKWCNSPTVFVG